VVYYGDVTDTRGCTACTCPGVPDLFCGGGVQFYTSVSCTTGPVGQPMFPPTCALVPVAATHAKYNATVTGVTCTSSGGSPTGSILGRNPATFCCQP
jgi:hypothetical protein